MPQNFLACDREQELMLPPSLREWLPEDHLASTSGEISSSASSISPPRVRCGTDAWGCDLSVGTSKNRLRLGPRWALRAARFVASRYAAQATRSGLGLLSVAPGHHVGAKSKRARDRARRQQLIVRRLSSDLDDRALHGTEERERGRPVGTDAPSRLYVVKRMIVVPL
jgi:hypothetical protein